MTTRNAIEDFTATPLVESFAEAEACRPGDDDAVRHGVRGALTVMRRIGSPGTSRERVAVLAGGSVLAARGLTLSTFRAGDTALPVAGHTEAAPPTP